MARTKKNRRKQHMLTAFILLVIVVPTGILSAFKKENPSTEIKKNNFSGESSMVTIPFHFLPAFEMDEENELKINEGAGEIEVPSEEIALVLIDTWNSDDPPEGEPVPEYLSNLENFLKLCRQNGITIIHAPNPPVVDKYPQYKKLKEEVDQYMSNYIEENPLPPFLSWPSENRYRDKVQEIRQEGRAAAYRINSKSDRDISRFLTPLKDEYVLSSHNEYRYVLWKEKIKVILYTGGSVNECMLHRDTGINLLAGIDKKNTNFTIVVLEDCVYTIGSPETDYQTSLQAMMDYYKRKIAVVSNSEDISFK